MKHLHDQTVEARQNVNIDKNIPNLARFQNCMIGLKVIAMLSDIWQIGWFAKANMSVLVNHPTVHSGAVASGRVNLESSILSYFFIGEDLIVQFFSGVTKKLVHR